MYELGIEVYVGTGSGRVASSRITARQDRREAFRKERGRWKTGPSLCVHTMGLERHGVSGHSTSFGVGTPKLNHKAARCFGGSGGIRWVRKRSRRLGEPADREKNDEADGYPIFI